MRGKKLDKQIINCLTDEVSRQHVYFHPRLLILTRIRLYFYLICVRWKTPGKTILKRHAVKVSSLKRVKLFKGNSLKFLMKILTAEKLQILLKVDSSL